jgi:hypothetical protein
MKKKFNLRKWIFNYLIYGYLVNIIVVVVTNYFLKDYLINKKELLGSFITCIVVMPLSLGFKNLYYEYKEIWKTAELDRKIFIILGIIFVVYGVYYRAKISGSFK